MKSKKLKEVLTGLIVLLLILFSVNNLKAEKSTMDTAILNNCASGGFEYEYEIREGVVWVLVFNDTGYLIDEYPAD